MNAPVKPEDLPPANVRLGRRIFHCWRLGIVVGAIGTPTLWLLIGSAGSREWAWTMIFLTIVPAIVSFPLIVILESVASARAEQVLRAPFRWAAAAFLLSTAYAAVFALGFGRGVMLMALPPSLCGALLFWRLMITQPLDP